MIGIVPEHSVDRALRSCQESGVKAWVIGDVIEGDDDGTSGGTHVATRVVSGTKGVNAGSVRMSGDYSLA